MASEDTLAAIRRVIRQRVEGRIGDLGGLIAALRQRADAIDNLAELLRQRADVADQRAEAAQTWATTVEARLTALTAAAAAGMRLRAVTLTLPALVPGPNNEFTVTFDTPFSAADYGVALTLEGAPAALARLMVGLKMGSRAPESCIAVVTNTTTAVTIPAGTQLHILAWRQPTATP